MKYHVWTFQDGKPPVLPKGPGGRPAFPGNHPGSTGTPSRASAKEEFGDVLAAVDRIMEIMTGNGVTDEAEKIIIRGKATEALSGLGAYRTALPVRGRWVLAERIKEGNRA